MPLWKCAQRLADAYVSHPGHPPLATFIGATLVVDCGSAMMDALATGAVFFCGVLSGSHGRLWHEECFYPGLFKHQPDSPLV